MFIADAHCDLLFQRMAGISNPDVTPQSLKTGSVGLQTFAAFVDKGEAKGKTVEMYRRQIVDFPVMAREYGLTPVSAVDETLPTDRQYALLAIEGGEAFGGSMERAAAYAAAGVKIVTVTWNYENELAYPNGHTGGIKPFGREVIDFLEACHVAIDVSHLNQQGFWELTDHCRTLMASHSCVMPLCGHKRNLTLEQIRAIIEKKGFIGINFNPPFLRGDTKARMEDLVRHMMYILELGGEDVLGFGSDFDGIASKPEGVETPSDFPNILAALRAVGVSEGLMEKIAYKNLLRFLGSL